MLHMCGTHFVYAFIVQDEDEELPTAWYYRFFLTPVFGYQPREAGSWQSSASQHDKYIARWGVLFEAAKGPKVQYQRDSANVNAHPTALAHTRKDRAREVLQLLGVSIAMLKLVLFADLLSGMHSGVPPVVQAVLLLVLSVLYCAYMRAFAPPTDLCELIVELSTTVCDIATFLVAVVVSALPGGSFNTL